MKSKIFVIATITVFVLAILLWLNQTGKISVFDWLKDKKDKGVTVTQENTSNPVSEETKPTTTETTSTPESADNPKDKTVSKEKNQSQYTLRWADEFDGKTERWTEADWAFEENESEFSKNNIAFDGGQLKLALTEKTEDKGNYSTKPYWGGEYYTTQEYSYGKYVVKMKPNSPSGVVSSFFLIHNDSTDWREIDIEFPGKTNQVQYNVRWMEEGKTGIQDDEHLVDLGFNASQDFHEYTIEWTPESISFLVDEKTSYQYTDPKILKEIAEPMSARMNYWISNSPEWAGSFDKNVLPLETYYDLVSYYELNR